MKNILIISNQEKENLLITDILNTIYCDKIEVATTFEMAKKLILENEFDLYIINNSCKNDNSISFAKELITKTKSEVIFIVNEDLYDYTSNYFEDIGVITISKPINKNVFIPILKVIKINDKKIKKLQKENDRLSKELHQIKLINRAKFVLITHLNMNETDAHKYIEKEAMNSRSAKIDVAIKILKTYDS